MFRAVNSGWPLESIHFRKSSYTKNQCNWRTDHRANVKEHKTSHKPQETRNTANKSATQDKAAQKDGGSGFKYTREGVERISHRWERLGWQGEVVEEDKDQMNPTELLTNEILNMSGWDTWKHTSSGNLQQKWWVQAVIIPLCLKSTQQKYKFSFSC